MFHVVLNQPEIAPNTGNVIRLCANTGCALHLVHPLGFTLDDRKLRRAGLDYHEWAKVHEYPSFDQFFSETRPARILLFSTQGQTGYDRIRYRRGDALVFGSETRGLPKQLMSSDLHSGILRIPMLPQQRSLNLSNAVAVVIYEGWRQNGFWQSV